MYFMEFSNRKLKSAKNGIEAHRAGKNDDKHTHTILPVLELFMQKTKQMFDYKHSSIAPKTFS